MKVHIRSKFYLLYVNLKNFLSTLEVRLVNNHIPVNPAWTEESLIKDFRPVCCRHYDDALFCIKPVHLRKKLCKCLFPFINTRYRTYTPGFPKGINFINKDYAGGKFFCL